MYAVVQRQIVLLSVEVRARCVWLPLSLAVSLCSSGMKCGMHSMHLNCKAESRRGGRQQIAEGRKMQDLAHVAQCITTHAQERQGTALNPGRHMTDSEHQRPVQLNKSTTVCTCRSGTDSTRTKAVARTVLLHSTV